MFDIYVSNDQKCGSLQTNDQFKTTTVLWLMAAKAVPSAAHDEANTVVSSQLDGEVYRAHDVFSGAHCKKR
jgi:hypothetical protein